MKNFRHGISHVCEKLKKRYGGGCNRQKARPWLQNTLTNVISTAKPRMHRVIMFYVFHAVFSPYHCSLHLSVSAERRVWVPCRARRDTTVYGATQQNGAFCFRSLDHSHPARQGVISAHVRWRSSVAWSLRSLGVACKDGQQDSGTTQT